jgi:hypothetical protein
MREDGKDDDREAIQCGNDTALNVMRLTITPRGLRDK